MEEVASVLPDHARPSRRSQAHEQGGEAPPIPARVATHADAPLADVPAPARAEEHSRWRERHPAPGSGRAMTQIVVTLAADGAAEDPREWRAFTGQTREAAHGRGWLDALPPADRAHAMRLWEAQEPADTPREAEVHIRREDGAYRAFVARLAPLPAAGGAERAWGGIFTHVPSAKRVEQALARARDELAAHDADTARLPEPLARIGAGRHHRRMS